MSKASKAEFQNLNIGYFDSPLGLIELITQNDCLIGLRFVDKKSKKVDQVDSFQLEVCRQLKAYFNLQLKCFSLNMYAKGTPFQQKVWTFVKNTRYNTTVSYQYMANEMKIPSSTRAIASAIGKNPILIVIPCHRIIGSDGSLKGYSAGTRIKAKLIDMENKKFFFSLPLNNL